MSGAASIKTRVLHVITDLGQGGAETVMFRLIDATRDIFEHAVVSLHKDGVFGERLRALGVPVTTLEMPRGRLTFAGLRALRHALREFRPDVVQTRLDHANLLGGLAARFNGNLPCVWAVHSSDLGSLRASWKTRLVRQTSAWLSRRLPVAITSDAVSSAQLHVKMGFSARKFVVIRNGVDATSFRPDEAARARVRAEWAVTPDTILAGCVARWDPAKDHENLVRAIHLSAQLPSSFRCALVGRGMSAGNAELRGMLDRLGVTDRFILAGPTSDVPAAMCALDLHILPSRSESQPVAVMEAMACGIPCVVTDVGDSADVVGRTGWVVPPRNPRALSDQISMALAELTTPAYAERRRAARDRIVSEFSLNRMASEYAAIWARAAAR